MSNNPETCPFCTQNTQLNPYMHQLYCFKYNHYTHIKNQLLSELQKEINDESNKLDTSDCINSCKICYNNYDKSVHLPKLLPYCGHTFCQKCLKSILRFDSKFFCPVCRHKYKQAIEKLPTNMALLDLLTTKSSTKELCPVHNMKFMAYCRDDELLLCGTCVIDHRSHDCKLVTDPSLADLAEKAKERLSSKLLTLNQQNLKLFEKNFELDSKITQIEACINKHIKELSHTKAAMIEKLDRNLNTCLAEVEECADKARIEAVSMCYEFNIKLFADDTRKVERRLNEFGNMSVVERLEGVELKSVQKEFINVNEIVYEALRRKRVKVDCWESLRGGRIVYMKI